MNRSFDAQFTALFHAHHPRVFRFLDRLSGDPELAADLTQDVFVRLYRRGALPERPEAWLITVALNLFRNEFHRRQRRARLLTPARSAAVHSDAPAVPDQGVDDAERRRVRLALSSLPERASHILLLSAEGYSTRDIAAALELKESSIGTLLARARRAFRSSYDAYCAGSHNTKIETRPEGSVHVK
jgi:RNA polymerase sigma-70 factor (ECF subfamily)